MNLLTPHPIAAERSLSQPSVSAELPSPTETPRLTADSAPSSTSRLSRSIMLLIGFWLASVAVGIRMTNGWYVIGVVTGAFAGTFVILLARHHEDWIIARLTALFGSVEFETSVYRRGYLYTLCLICRSDVHDTGVCCPRQLSGDCSACGQRVLLDGYGNCYGGSAVANTHVIAPSSIHPTTEREWLRMHILRLCGESEADHA